MEATSRPARDQHQENRCPLFNKPSRWSLRMSRLRHPSMVVFLFHRYQLPEPAPPNTFHLLLFAEIIRQVYLCSRLFSTSFPYSCALKQNPWCSPLAPTVGPGITPGASKEAHLVRPVVHQRVPPPDGR